MSAEEITESSKKSAPVREANVEKNKRGRPTKKVEAIPAAAPIVSEPIATKVTKVTHPTYTQMIINGIRALKETSGSSRQAILKYIIATYGLQPQLASIRTRAVIRKALTSGLLKYGKTNGCFKVGDEEKRKIEKLEKAKSKKPRTAAETVVAIQPGIVSKQTKKPKKETKTKETKVKETKDKETKTAAKSPAKKQRGRPAKTDTKAVDKVETPTKVQKAAPVEKQANKAAKATKNVEKRKTKEETVESPTKKVKIAVHKRLSITRNASAVASIKAPKTGNAVKTKSTKKSSKTKNTAALTA